MDTPKNTQTKAGFLTSEFWLTIGSAVTGILVMLGYLTPQQADDFTSAVVAVVGGLVTISTTVVYIVGRVQLKREQGVSGSQTPQVLEGIPDQPQTGAFVP